MPESIGEYLKHLRVEKGLSIEEIARHTRIDPAYLQALEENDFAKLPPARLFAKAYVKAYSHCLALPEAQEAEALERFGESAGPFYNVIESRRIGTVQDLGAGRMLKSRMAEVSSRLGAFRGSLTE